ncbi:hypothetical protein RB597_002133 [Gaeumannomyces tritici]
MPVTVTPIKAINFRNMSASFSRVPSRVETQFRNVTRARPTSATDLPTQGFIVSASAPMKARTKYSPMMIAMMAALPGLSTSTATHEKRKPDSSPMILHAGDDPDNYGRARRPDVDVDLARRRKDSGADDQTNDQREAVEPEPVVEESGKRFAARSKPDETEKERSWRFVRPYDEAAAAGLCESRGSSRSSEALRDEDMLGRESVSSAVSSWLELASDASSRESRACPCALEYRCGIGLKGRRGEPRLAPGIGGVVGSVRFRGVLLVVFV